MKSLPPSLQTGQFEATLAIEPSGIEWYFENLAKHWGSAWTFLKRTDVCVALQKDDLPVAHDDKGIAIAGTAFGSEGIIRENT